MTLNLNRAVWVQTPGSSSCKSPLMFLQQRQILIYLGGLPGVWNEELLNLGALMLDSDRTLERTQGQQKFNSFFKWNKPQTKGKLKRCTSLPILPRSKERRREEKGF